MRKFGDPTASVLRILLAALVLGAAQPLAADDKISIGSLSLDWPDGFSNRRFGDALLLIGPESESVVVSYLRGQNNFSKAARLRFSRMHHQFALRALPNSAAVRGGIVQPLRSIRLANEAMVYSIASQAQDGSGAHYYLEYFVVGPFSAALFKLEGHGDALTQVSRFDLVFASARWNEVTVAHYF